MSRSLTSVVAGMKSLGRIVEVAYGPAGRRIVMEKSFGPPLQTWKAAVVASELNFPLSEKDEVFGAAAAKEAATESEARTTDGSSLAVLIAQGLVEALVQTGDPDSILRAVDAVRSRIRESAVPIGDRLPEVIATAACQHAAVELLVKEACAQVDPSRVALTMRAGASSRVVARRGYVLEGGWCTPELATSDPEHAFEKAQLIAVLENPRVAMFPDGCNDVNTEDVLAALRQAFRESRPLLLLAPSYAPNVLAILRHANFASQFLQTGTAVADLPEDGQLICQLLENEIPSRICAATSRMPDGRLDGCTRALVSRKQARLEGDFGSELATIELGNEDATVDPHRIRDALAASQQASQGIVIGGGRALQSAARAAALDVRLIAAFERPRQLLETSEATEHLWDPFTVVDSAVLAARDCLKKVAR